MRVKITMSKLVEITVKEHMLINDTRTVERIEEGIIEFHTSNAMPNVASLVGKQIHWGYYDFYKIISAEAL